MQIMVSILKASFLINLDFKILKYDDYNDFELYKIIKITWQAGYSWNKYFHTWLWKAASVNIILNIAWNIQAFVFSYISLIIMLYWNTQQTNNSTMHKFWSSMKHLTNDQFSY